MLQYGKCCTVINCWLIHVWESLTYSDCFGIDTMFEDPRYDALHRRPEEEEVRAFEPGSEQCDRFQEWRRDQEGLHESLWHMLQSGCAAANARRQSVGMACGALDRIDGTGDAAKEQWSVL
jgi:hypothetical protein